MVLSTGEKRQAAIWFKEQYNEGRNKVSEQHKDDIFTLLDEIDAALDATPANAGQSIGLNIYNAMSTAIINKASTGERSTVAAILLAAVCLVRAAR